MKKAYADIAEGQVHYATDGVGEPLLLLHRSPRSWTYYRRVLPILARSRRVIAMDTLGFGNSDSAPPHYQLPDYVESVVRFLDALGIEKTDVWGSMTGSAIGMELAIRWPQRVRRLVLMSVPIFLTQEEKESKEVQKRQVSFVPNAGGAFLSNIWTWVLRSSQITNEDQLDSELTTDMVIDAVRAGPIYGQAALKVYSHQSNCRSRLPLIKAETLVIGFTGENVPLSVAPFSKEDHAREVQALIPNSKLVILSGPGAHEEVANTRAKDLADVVLPFLER